MEVGGLTINISMACSDKRSKENKYSYDASVTAGKIYT